MCSRHTSQLLLINDATSGAGVILATTRMRAILRGTPQGRILINNLTAGRPHQAGRTGLTSGGDQVFPRGLPVGTIETIEPDPEHQPYTSIMLKPAANLNQLEEVLVITGTSANLDAKLQGDLAADASMTAEARAQAEANAQARAHAADLNAARLPSLHEGAAADATPNPKTMDTAPPAENSTGLVPKPKAPLHPDRYSAGAAPAADELIPGAPRSDAAHRKELEALMATRSYTSRREFEQYHFGIVVTVAVPLLCSCCRPICPSFSRSS